MRLRVSLRVFSWFGCVVIALAACSGEHPGGTVGDACQDAGSAEECAEGEVCDELVEYGPYCLAVCETHDDCDPNERCNGVTGGNTKACHPQDPCDDPAVDASCP